jgi:hypothetical protein
MDEQTFWELVDTVGADPAGFDRLADQLSDHGAADIRDFADHLARALHALDTPAHYRAVETSDTSFLGVRCAVVAAGAREYRKVLTAPAALAGYANRPGAQLLPVAERAYRTATRTPWQHKTVVGTDTGSNADAWRDTWLHPHMGTTTGDGCAPQDYMAALRHVALTLDGDHAWRTWWRHSGLVACELGIVAEGRLDHLRPSADIRRCGNRLRANFTCAQPTGCADRAEMFERAASEVRDMFEVIREAMTLPALPPTPYVQTLPANINDVPVTTKPLPSVPYELEPQGYLTLAQIQEFFG